MCILFFSLSKVVFSQNIHQDFHAVTNSSACIHIVLTVLRKSNANNIAEYRDTSAIFKRYFSCNDISAIHCRAIVLTAAIYRRCIVELLAICRLSLAINRCSSRIYRFRLPDLSFTPPKPISFTRHIFTT